MTGDSTISPEDQRHQSGPGASFGNPAKIEGMLIERPSVQAPDFPPLEWINTSSPPSLKDFRGQVVLIDIWDFTCAACLHTLPYLRDWYDRYADHGFEILGVHTPEFSFAHAKNQVESAVKRLGIRWPVVLDNAREVWSAYANRFWPTFYLLDRDGFLRYRLVGERGYADAERAIQALLLEAQPELVLPRPVPLARPEDAVDAILYPTTPELHIDAVANQPPPLDIPLLFEAPASRSDGHFYLEGTWVGSKDGLSMAGDKGAIILPYQAASVNAVLSPSPDAVTLALQLEEPMEAELWLDGQIITREAYGSDVFLDRGLTKIRVDTPRMYNLVRHLSVARAELRIAVLGPNFTLYAFSFGSSLATDEGTLQISLRE